jgi:hypothetical protein
MAEKKLESKPLECPYLEKIVNTNLTFTPNKPEDVILSVLVDRIIFIGIKEGRMPNIKLEDIKGLIEPIKKIGEYPEAIYYKRGDNGYIVCFRRNGSVPNSSIWHGGNYEPNQTPSELFKKRKEYLRELSLNQTPIKE